jgi:hypothetical protein
MPSVYPVFKQGSDIFLGAFPFLMAEATIEAFFHAMESHTIFA